MRARTKKAEPRHQSLPIDFVLYWVDDSDESWRRQRDRYAGEAHRSSTAANRFRDWGLLRYWFRAVERFAPWVRTVHFVTCGHVPDWLDLGNPRLHFVRHDEYIPNELLPLFNSSAIEVFLHRIDGLAQQFVLFNDDTFLAAPCEPTDFFQDGLPCDCALMGTINSASYDDIFQHVVLNNSAIINAHFSKREVLRKHRAKFLSPCYGKDLMRNLCLWNTQRFSCFYQPHLPTSHLRGTWEEVWDAEGDVLYAVGRNRFRTDRDLTQWLFRDWNLCAGRFVPRSPSWGRLLSIGVDDNVAQTVASGRYKALCLNDDDPDLDFELERSALEQAFQELLPQPSSFEKH